MPTISSLKRSLAQLGNYEDSALKRQVTQNAIVFSNLNRFKLFLGHLADLGIFDKEIEQLRKSQLFATTAEGLSVQSAHGADAIAETAAYIYYAVNALNRVIPKLLPDEPKECVFIRFPDAEDIGTITRDLQAIEKAVLQMVTQANVGGSFKVLRWESGSLWIHVFVATAEAVAVVAAAAGAAAVVAKKWMEFAMFGEHARGLRIKNDSLEDLKSAQAKLLEELLLAESRNLTEKYLSPEGNEEVVQRVRYSVKTISELIRRGGEVSPSLNAPEDVRKLFPDYKTLATALSSIKQIEENSSDKVAE